MDAIARRAARAARRPRVVTIEWLDPIMLGGTWMPELIELAGRRLPWAPTAGRPAPTLTSAALTALEPDVVLVKPCGFDITRTLQERELVDRALVRAVKPETVVVVLDGNAFFNRPGPRLVESLEILAAVIHPNLFRGFRRQARARAARPALTCRRS